MESTSEVSPIPCWQSSWHWRRRPGLYQLLFEQLWGAFPEHDSMCQAVEEPVVEAVVCGVADVVAEVAARLEVGVSAALSAKIPG